MKSILFYTSLSLVIIVILAVTSILIWQNRSDGKLISSFFSFLLIGSLGLLINALVSLESHRIENSYFGNVIYNLKHEKIIPHGKLLTPNNYSASYDNVLSINSNLTQKIHDKTEIELHLVSQYISYLLGSTYSNSWLDSNHNYLHDGKVSFTSNLQIIDENRLNLIPSA
ncbi:MAG: hypothetical protein AAF391_11200 [Bacteroidota bacterium]